MKKDYKFQYYNDKKNPGYGTEYMVMDSRDVKVRGGRLYRVKPLGKKDFFIGGLDNA